MYLGFCALKAEMLLILSGWHSVCVICIKRYQSVGFQYYLTWLWTTAVVFFFFFLSFPHRSKWIKNESWWEQCHLPSSLTTTWLLLFNLIVFAIQHIFNYNPLISSLTENISKTFFLLTSWSNSGYVLFIHYMLSNNQVFGLLPPHMMQF